MEIYQVKLDIGSGKFPQEGYKNIDINPIVKPDECYDVTNGIREASGTVNEVLLSHVLMYFTQPVVESVLNECYRVLIPNGIICITEDNGQVKKRNQAQQAQYGDGILFTREGMEQKLRKAGFVDIKETKPFREIRSFPEDYPLATGKASVYFLKANKGKEKHPIVYLGLDDFGEKNCNLDILWRLRDYFDDFKVNLFAIPNNNLNKEWIRYIKNLDWIQLCLHGYNHTSNEEIDKIVLKTITPEPFARIYKAPRWELSESMYERLTELGFKILLYPSDDREGIKFN